MVIQKAQRESRMTSSHRKIVRGLFFMSVLYVCERQQMWRLPLANSRVLDVGVSKISRYGANEKGLKSTGSCQGVAPRPRM